MLNQHTLDLGAPNSKAERQFCFTTNGWQKSRGNVYLFATQGRREEIGDLCYKFATTHKQTALDLARAGPEILHAFALLLDALFTEYAAQQLLFELVNGEDVRGQYFIVRSSTGITVTFTLSPAGN